VEPQESVSLCHLRDNFRHLVCVDYVLRTCRAYELGVFIMATADAQRGSVISGAMWMIVLGLLLFWLPVVGPLIAGFVGGRKAGSMGAALTASIIPALLAAGLLLLIGSVFGLPLIGAIAGAGVFVIIAVETVPMMLAAIVGGATAD
jgi:hypothetical protein